MRKRRQGKGREGPPTDVDCFEQLANFESEIRYRSRHICGTSSSAATCNTVATLWLLLSSFLLLPSLRCASNAFGVKQVDQQQQNQNYFDKFSVECATGEVEEKGKKV